MKWSIAGGEVILRLRVLVLSGVWEAVYRKHLNHRPEVARTTCTGHNSPTYPTRKLLDFDRMS